MAAAGAGTLATLGLLAGLVTVLAKPPGEADAHMVRAAASGAASAAVAAAAPSAGVAASASAAVAAASAAIPAASAVAHAASAGGSAGAGVAGEAGAHPGHAAAASGAGAGRAVTEAASAPVVAQAPVEAASRPVSERARRGRVDLPPLVDRLADAQRHELRTEARSLRGQPAIDPSAKAWALVTLPLADKQQSQRVAAQLQAVALLQPLPMRAELVQAQGRWRAVFWPFASEKDAEKVRLALADKGLKTEVVAF